MNEKKLVKLMKAAYKGGGVKVWRSAKDVLCLVGPGWACAMLWKYVPGPVLGLIAGWCHGLPHKGEGWWCMDAYGDAPDQLDGMPEPLPTLQDSPVLEDSLITMDFAFMGYRAAQSDGHRIRWFDAVGIEMLDRLATFGGDVLDIYNAMPWGRWHDPETGTVIYLETVERIRPDLTAKLGEIDYRKPGGGSYDRV